MDLMVGKKPGGGPGSDSGYIKDVGVATFEREVIAASAQVPVIVDFWAPWCGPCKQLGPMLEKAVTAQGGKLRMAKINIDENPEIAQALRVRSVPTVYAFYKGQPVDGFTGAIPESQIKQFVDRLLAQAGGTGTGVEAMLEDAKAAMAQGETELAQDLYSEILVADPANAPARAGLTRLVLEAGDTAAARMLLEKTPPGAAKHPDIVAVRAALDLAEQSSAIAASEDLQAKLEKNPDDHAVRFDLAMAYYAEGNREMAVDTLLDLVRRDRSWNEDQARKQLVKFFEAFGFADPLSVSGRKRLSTILFS